MHNIYTHMHIVVFLTIKYYMLIYITMTKLGTQIYIDNFLKIIVACTDLLSFTNTLGVLYLHYVI